MSTRSRSGAHAPFRSLAVALMVALAVGSFPPAFADDPDRMREELAEVERRAVELDERSRVVERELEDTREELTSLEEQLREVSDQLFEAQTRERLATEDAALARGQSERALRQLAASQDELSTNADRLGGLARDAYKYGAPHNSVVSLVGSVTIDEGPGQFADAVHYLDRGIGTWSVLVERSQALVTQVDASAARAEEERQRQEVMLAAAERARDDAAEAHAKAAELVGRASLQERRQEELVAELEVARSDARQRIGLLEGRIEAEERRRAEAEAQRRREAEAEARRQREAEARRQREAEARRQREAEARRQRAQAGQQRASQPRPSAPSTEIVGVGSGLVTVGGITVSSSLGPALQALLDAARADGIVLGGHGWRSTESQARLRVANGCRDVYTSPASSCRVPTAIPGSSEHEKGLAIDFTWQGRTICYPRASRNCTGNAAFDWLQANAGRYGLRNLPSEAWHWSTTGR